MKKKGSFGDSATGHFLFSLIAPVMESRLRRKLFGPVRILKRAGIRSGQDVLEVGCGTGFFTMPAAKLVGDEGHVHAIDSHPRAIEKVARKIREAALANVRLIKADAIETGLTSDCIDLVLLLGVIPSPTLPLCRLLPEMHRVLRPEGALAVWTACPWWSPASLTEKGLFVHGAREDGVHIFRRGTSD
jgi:demethylmenaquinone methyltransferase/2-methoxy-6-polyprenyl-1,4-benzoquinol methylase